MVAFPVGCGKKAAPKEGAAKVACLIATLSEVDILYRGCKLQQACPRWRFEFTAKGSQIISRRAVVIMRHGARTAWRLVDLAGVIGASQSGPFVQQHGSAKNGDEDRDSMPNSDEAEERLPRMAAGATRLPRWRATEMTS